MYNATWGHKSNCFNLFQVFNPANGEVICNVTDCSLEDVEEAVQAAVIAFKSFKETTAKVHLFTLFAKCWAKYVQFAYSPKHS